MNSTLPVSNHEKRVERGIEELEVLAPIALVRFNCALYGIYPILCLEVKINRHANPRRTNCKSPNKPRAL